jgi:TRAP transporter 4TM/12TM fusion protein
MTIEESKTPGSKYRNAHLVWRAIFIAFTLAGTILAVLQIFLIYPILENAYLYWLLVFYLSPVFIFFPATSRSPTDRVPLYDIILFFLTIFFSAYLSLHAWEIAHEGWAFLAPLPVSIMSALFCLIILEAVRRAGGFPLFLFTAIFATYPLFAESMPGALKGNEYPFLQVVRYHVLSTESIIGIPMFVVGTLIIGFMILGSALVTTGGGKFFLDFAFALLGSQRGGPAKVAILSSGIFGSLSGSVISNVLTTGSVTIPTMKKIGYPPHYAAAVEACASSGGCIMPPVMGAVAFVMASFLGISYVDVAIAALIPAVLFYLGLFVQVDFFARKTGLEGLPKKDIPQLSTVLREGFLYIFAFLVLIYFLYLRREAQAPFYATVALLILAMMRSKTRLHLKQYIKFIESVGLILSELVAILAACGFIIGAFSLTGVASSFSREIILLAQGNAFFMLVFGAIASFIMGMGMTVTACYIFLSIILVPGLISAGGFDVLAVHLFVLYWGVVSFITPPVALGSYAAAGLAGASPMQTGFTSMRLGVVKYIIPFFFVYSPALIMHGPPHEIIYELIGAIIGIFILAGGLEGYIPRLGKLPPLIRLLYVVSGLLIVMPQVTTDIIGVGLFLVVTFFYLLLRHYSKKGNSDSGGRKFADQGF